MTDERNTIRLPQASRRRSAPPTHSAFEHIRTAGGIHEFRHRGNTLTVLLQGGFTTPVAAFQVTFRVGSRNEGAGLTGATHLLEHLMFKGTERFNRDNGTSVFQVLQALGAEMNATTWYDRTNYYELLPSEHLERAIEIEADRMRGARIAAEDLASERVVVLNELDQGENDPLQRLMHAVYAAAFPAHSYGHPVIGWKSDVETVSAEGLRHFYDTYYWPENATVTVVGNLDEVETLDLIDRHFGTLPPGPETNHSGPEPLVHRDVVTAEPDQCGERRVTIKQAGELGSVMLGYKAPPGLETSADALDVLQQVLGGGKTSRLHKRLTDPGLTTGTWAFYPRLRDPGLFVLFAALSPDVEHETVEAEIVAALADVAENGLEASELERARRQVIAQEAFNRDGPFNVVAALNEAIAVGDWTLFANYRSRIEAVSLEDIQTAAATLANPDRLTVGHYVPVQKSSLRADEAISN